MHVCIAHMLFVHVVWQAPCPGNLGRLMDSYVGFGFVGFVGVPLSVSPCLVVVFVCAFSSFPPPGVRFSISPPLRLLGFSLLSSSSFVLPAGHDS